MNSAIHLISMRVAFNKHNAVQARHVAPSAPGKKPGPPKLETSLPEPPS